MGGLLVVALDGHDGSGKTTLAHAVATRIGGTYVRPFGGDAGRQLLVAAESGDIARTLEVGEQAIRGALRAVPSERCAVLDRGWMTVASLMPWDVFAGAWTLWFATILCAASLDTTLARLAARDEAPADREWHREYIDRYQRLAAQTGSPLVTTDCADAGVATEQAVAIAQQLTAAHDAARWKP